MKVFQNIGVKVRGRTVRPKPKARPKACGTLRVVRGRILFTDKF